MAKKKTTGENKGKVAKAQARPVPAAEIGGLILGAVGLFLLLSLMSYQPGDPSLNTSTSGEEIHNLGGILGSYLADVVYQLCGFTALLLPLIAIYLGIQFVRFGFFRPALRPTLGLALLTPAVAALLHLQLRMAAGAEPSRAGGLLGAVVGDLAHQWLGSVGAYIGLLVFTLLSLQISIGFQMGPLVDRVVVTLHHLLPGMFRWAGATASVGAVSAGRFVKDRYSSWREARESEPDEGYNNPLADNDDEEEEEEKEVAPARGGRPAEAKRPDVPREIKMKEPLPLLPREDEGEDEGDEDPGVDSPDQGEGEEVPPLSLEEAAAAFKARRLAKQQQGAGPKIIKSRAAEEAAGAGASVSGALSGGQNQVFQLPPLSLLQLSSRSATSSVDEADLRANARLLEEKFRDYGVDGEVVEIHPGPIINMYEYVPAPGIKVSKITNLANDLAMALKATRIRIVAPIPGKAAVGIEVPNRKRETVYLRDVLAHETFVNKDLKLPIALGKDTEGIPFAGDMAKMPHLLVAGATGTGKSVAVNSMILSLLFSRTPEEVRLILVDPKMLEFSLYNDIPHLLLPVVTNPKKAAQALGWGVDEMTRRYKLLSRVGTRNIANYNQKVEKELARWEQFGGPPPDFVPWEEDSDETMDGPKPPRKLPYIVIIIDELADLMMVAAKEVQDHIVRLAQMARAAGIHLLLATQRPSVDVITGLIKANFPSRISFQVSSKIDSRTILDTMGAEALLGMGDMLYLPPGVAKLIRLHGPFVSDDEVKAVVDHVKAQGAPQYEQSLIATMAADEDGEESAPKRDSEDYDEFYDQAVALVAETRQVSVSGIQRRLKIGYNRSARIVEVMEKEGVVSPADHQGKRTVLVPSLGGR